MFGIKKKVYYISALVCAIIGIVVLGLKVFRVFEDDTIYTLIALVFLLLGFALYLRPGLKQMKTTQAIQAQYRNSLYTIITKDSSSNKIDLYDLDFYVNDKRQVYFVSKKTQEMLVFETLNFYEAKYIILTLLRDFALIVYSDGIKNKKAEKATVPEVVVRFHDGDEEKEYYIIKDYYFNKNI